MALFSKRRKDGDLVKDGDPMTRIMPYVMPGRNESAVYYRMTKYVKILTQFVPPASSETGQALILLHAAENGAQRRTA